MKTKNISVTMWDNRRSSYSVDVETNTYITDSQFNKLKDRYNTANASYRIAFIDDEGQEVDHFYAEDIDFI
jgi:nitrogen fixation protein FixH